MFLIGGYLLLLLQAEKNNLVQKFSYPLFIQQKYTLESGEVTDFLTSIRTTTSGIFPLQIIERSDALDLQIQNDPSLL